MAEIGYRFTELVEAVKSKEPRLLPVLSAYKPESWLTRGLAEDFHYHIGLLAKTGTRVVDTYGYTKWEWDDCTSERKEVGPFTEHISTRGDTQVITRNDHHTPHKWNTSLQINGQTIRWNESGVSVSAGDSCIEATPKVLQFKATVQGHDYLFDIYEDGAEFAKAIKF